jgi:hypothetical protein
LTRCLCKLFVGHSVIVLITATGAQCRKWAWREFEPSDTSVLYPPPSDIKTVAEFHDIARNVPLSANWLNADRQGMGEGKHIPRVTLFSNHFRSLLVSPQAISATSKAAACLHGILLSTRLFRFLDGRPRTGALPSPIALVHLLNVWCSPDHCHNNPPIYSDGTARLTPISCSRSLILPRYSSGLGLRTA